MCVKAYLFNGYWADIGTIKSFFEANLALAQVCLPASTAIPAACSFP
jgi:ADP-glucose pyrophosphorylase